MLTWSLQQQRGGAEGDPPPPPPPPAPQAVPSPDAEAEDAARHQEPHQIVDDHNQQQQAQNGPHDGSRDHASLDGHCRKEDGTFRGDQHHPPRGPRATSNTRFLTFCC